MQMRGASVHDGLVANVKVAGPILPKGVVSRAKRFRHDLEVRLRKIFKMKKKGFRFKKEQYAGPFKDGLWGEVERALSYHSVAVTPLRTLNNLIEKQARLLGFSCTEPIDVTAAVVTSESWPTERLAQLPRMHDRDLPRDEDYPILIYHADEVTAILDGHTRVNKWARGRASGDRWVLVVRPASTAPDARNRPQAPES
jgi:hypothetical protein